METVIKEGFALIGGLLMTLVFILFIELSILNKNLYRIVSKFEGENDNENNKQNRKN